MLTVEQDRARRARDAHSRAERVARLVRRRKRECVHGVSLRVDCRTCWEQRTEGPYWPTIMT